GDGADEGTRDPAVGIRGLAEARDMPLDAGQVLEVRRRREEEHVDALFLHALGHAPAAPLVVEHGSECTRSGVPPSPAAGCTIVQDESHFMGLASHAWVDGRCWLRRCWRMLASAAVSTCVPLRPASE